MLATKSRPILGDRCLFFVRDQHHLQRLYGPGLGLGELGHEVRQECDMPEAIGDASGVERSAVHSQDERVVLPTLALTMRRNDIEVGADEADASIPRSWNGDHQARSALVTRRCQKLGAKIARGHVGLEHRQHELGRAGLFWNQAHVR